MPEPRAKRKLVVVAQPTISLTVALLTAMLFALSTHGQVRGVASARARNAGTSFRHGGQARLVGPARHRSSNGYIFYPFYYPFYSSDYDYYHSDYEPVESPEKAVLAQQESVLIAHPAESLILENRDGQWVRIPTGTHLPISPGAEVSGPSDAAFRPPIKLPPTVLVFRDGHQEEVQRYVVQGTDLYNGADYWSSGTWTRRIPIAELDVPTSLKVNAARGGNFSLPTRSYEVIVRF